MGEGKQPLTAPAAPPGIAAAIDGVVHVVEALQVMAAPTRRAGAGGGLPALPLLRALRQGRAPVALRSDAQATTPIKDPMAARVVWAPVSPTGCDIGFPHRLPPTPAEASPSPSPSALTDSSQAARSAVEAAWAHLHWA